MNNGKRRIVGGDWRQVAFHGVKRNRCAPRSACQQDLPFGLPGGIEEWLEQLPHDAEGKAALQLSASRRHHSHSSRLRLRRGRTQQRRLSDSSGADYHQQAAATRPCPAQ
jgi:hypothetical protein